MLSGVCVIEKNNKLIERQDEDDFHQVLRENQNEREETCEKTEIRKKPAKIEINCHPVRWSANGICALARRSA